VPTPDEIARLRAEARRLRVESEAAFDRGDAAAGVLALERAMVREQGAELMEKRPGLPARKQSDTKRGMVSAARAHISAGQARAKNEGRLDPLIEAANKKGHTLRSLAKAVDVPASIISRARTGTRRIKRSAAKAIEKLTGFPATADNWPGGWTEE
jgi:hypothetical protein